MLGWWFSGIPCVTPTSLPFAPRRGVTWESGVTLGTEERGWVGVEVAEWVKWQVGLLGSRLRLGRPGLWVVVALVGRRVLVRSL